MRGNSDRSDTYPFSIAPASGWGNENPSGEYVITDARKLSGAVKLTPQGYEHVELDKATRFQNAGDAAIASGKLLEQVSALA